MLNLRLPIVLASASPRRRELLGTVLEKFEIVASGVDEDALAKEDPWVNAKHLACSKSFKVFLQFPESLVIGADTVVAVPQEEGYLQLAKPVNAEDAVRILSILSGREHKVITGVSLHWPDGHESLSVTSTVHFKSLTEGQIRDYIASGEPMDKAGAYGAQGRGRELIEVVDGPLSNVIGLPMEELTERLKAFSRS